MFCFFQAEKLFFLIFKNLLQNVYVHWLQCWLTGLTHSLERNARKEVTVSWISLAVSITFQNERILWSNTPEKYLFYFSLRKSQHTPEYQSGEKSWRGESCLTLFNSLFPKLISRNWLFIFWGIPFLNITSGTMLEAYVSECCLSYIAICSSKQLSIRKIRRILSSTTLKFFLS